MNLIKQPNNWTCGAACVCMLTGTTLEEFYEYCGHDGSQRVEYTPARWMGVRCFDIKEMIRYLLEYDYFLGLGASGVDGDFDPAKMILTVSCDWERQSVLVDVSSGTDGKGIHQLLWSHELKRLIDPYFPETERQFSDYKIVGWWPVVKANGAMS
jgi:hypothetical protein